MASSQDSSNSSLPSMKRPKRLCHFDDSWPKEFKGIKKSSLGDTFACCVLCNSDFSIGHGGQNDVTAHVKGKRHNDITKVAGSLKSVSSYFSQPASQKTISAEA